MSSDNEAKLRRAAIVLRDMCASNTFTSSRNHDPELELEGIDADEVYPGVFIGIYYTTKRQNGLYCTH